MKKILLLIFIPILLIGCTKKENTRTLDDIIKENNYIIVDVRTQEEYNEGHVVNSVNIPLDNIDSNVNLDKSKTIIVYCKSGRRSKMAYERLKSMNYDVYDLGKYESIELDKE